VSTKPKRRSKAPSGIEFYCLKEKTRHTIPMRQAKLVRVGKRRAYTARCPKTKIRLFRFTG